MHGRKQTNKQTNIHTRVLQCSPASVKFPGNASTLFRRNFRGFYFRETNA